MISEAKKFDPSLIELKFRPEGNRLFATLDQRHLVYDDLPMEYLGYARLQMAGYVSREIFSRFEIFENRFHAICNRMRELNWSSPVTFVIAAGTSIENGFQLAASPDCVARLTITAPQSIVRNWRAAPFALSVQMALDELKIKNAPNKADIRQALVLAANFNQEIKDFAVREAAQSTALFHEGRPYLIRLDSERSMVELIVRRPDEIKSEEILHELYLKINSAARDLAKSKNSSPYFRVYWKHILTSLKEALEGPPSIRLEVPFHILAASVFPGTKVAQSFPSVVAWNLANLKLLALEKDDLAKIFYSPELAEEVKDALPAMKELGLFEVKDGCWSQSPALIHDPLHQCNSAEDPYYIQSLRLASESIEVIANNERHIHALTLSFSKESFNALREILVQLRKKIFAIVKEESLPPAQVWQINWQFFPLTKIPSPDGTEVADLVEEKGNGNEPRSIVFLIRELVALGSFRADAPWIAQKLYPRFSLDAIQRTLAILESKGMIAFSKVKGRYIQVERDVKTNEVVDGLAIIDYHNEMLKIAEAAIKYAKPDQRDIAGLMLTLPRGGDHLIKDLLMKTLREVFDTAGRDSNPDTLFQMNLQFFPITKL